MWKGAILLKLYLHEAIVLSLGGVLAIIGYSCVDAFANLTTVAGFGLLAFSSVPILQAMGVTVAPGVVLALIYAAIFARQSDA